jgi:hypothetical protein
MNVIFCGERRVSAKESLVELAFHGIPATKPAHESREQVADKLIQ